MGDKYICGQGPVNAKVMILCECPTYEDAEKGKLFAAKEWRELDFLLVEAGIRREQCWQTAVSKYHVPPSPKSGKKSIPFAVRAQQHGINLQQQVSELQQEVNAIQPNVIIGLGKTPLWATTGKTKIDKYRGSILLGMGRKFIPTYNPCHLSWQATDVEFVGYWNRQIMLFDFKRAVGQATFSDLKLPPRNLQIARNSYMLHEFREKYRNYTKPAVDIEARGQCIPFCVGLAFTPFHGLTVPLWNVGEIESVCKIPDSDLVSMWILLAQILAENDIVGQNFKYDQDKIARLGFIIRSLASDVMLKAFAINPELPKNLAFNTSLFTEEPFYKDEGMYHGKVEDLLLGCARDSCVTKEIDLAMDADIDELGMRDYFSNFIMPLHELYLGMENIGFRVDKHTRDNILLPKYIEWDEKIRYELFHLVGAEVNVNSPTQIATLLFDNLKLPRKSGTGEEEITALLNSQSAIKNPTHRRICELVLEGRRVRKSVSHYLMAMPDYDERMRTTFFLCNDTGRTSTGQQDPPIRPIVEVIDENGKKKDRVLGVAFQTITKHGDIGNDIRQMYVPDKGEIFLQADSAQAEARVVFLLANDEQALTDIDARDYHALTATWFFGGTEDDYSKKKLGYEHPIRFAGKTLRHAGHLGAGKRRAAISVNTDARKYKVPISITEAIAERALKIFHSKQPKIQQVFHKGVIDALGKNRRLVAPVPYGVNSKTGGVRTFYERWGDELFRQAFSYIPQRSITDNTKAAALRIKKSNRFIKIIMESHDSLLFSIEERFHTEMSGLIKYEMERPIRFDTCSISRRDLIVPCEVEIGYNYMELRKMKNVPLYEPIQELTMPLPTPNEVFSGVVLPEDSKLTTLIYNAEERRKAEIRSFYVND